MSSDAASPLRTGADLRGVSFAYSRTDGTRPFRLEIEELCLAPGEAAAVIGPSGSGKTTLVQEFELLDYLSALDNILVPLRIRGANRAELRSGRARATELAAAVGIADLLGRLPAQLSQGERQRVAIARALVTDPALVLCDEPTGNLDPEAASHAVDLLLQQARARGAALLMVTHDHGLLDRFDRVIDVTTLARGAGSGGPNE